MRVAHTLVAASLILAAVAVPAAAQSETRPAVTTVSGDTGLWFVPTGEVLPAGSMSVAGYRTELDFRQGNTSVSSFPITAAFGLPRAELFGALHVVTRIDRDTSPLLYSGTDGATGGLVNDFPEVRNTWTGNRFGDLYLGGKVGLMTPQPQRPLALAFRGIAKMPTGDEDEGASTGRWDWFTDVIASGEVGRVEVSGFGGLAMRGDPGDISISDGFRWGGGIGFPSRGPLRATAEAYGEWAFDDAVTAPEGLLIADDGSRSPTVSGLDNHLSTAFGVTWQLQSGMLLGAALKYRFGLDTQSTPGTEPTSGTDAIGLEFRLGFHGGVRARVAPVAAAPVPPPPPAPPAVAAAPPPAPTPAPPPAAANRLPTLRAVCDPCRLGVGAAATVRAEATDPDGDPLTYTWSANGGTLADARVATTTWRAGNTPGSILLTVTAADGRGGTASARVTIDVVGDPLTFEDVHFDLDSHMLRPDAIGKLRPVAGTMVQRPELRLLVEGHTCDLGTSEYNLALGERRAQAVRDLLVSLGVDADRVQTISYGEEHPAHDNVHEQSRRLNRRAVMVVRFESAK